MLKQIVQHLDLILHCLYELSVDIQLYNYTVHNIAVVNARSAQSLLFHRNIFFHYYYIHFIVRIDKTVSSTHSWN